MIPAHVRERQEDQEFKAGFSHTVDLREDLVSENHKEAWLTSWLEEEEKGKAGVSLLREEGSRGRDQAGAK